MITSLNLELFFGYIAVTVSAQYINKRPSSHGKNLGVLFSLALTGLLAASVIPYEANRWAITALAIFGFHLILGEVLGLHFEKFRTRGDEFQARDLPERSNDNDDDKRRIQASESGRAHS